MMATMMIATVGVWRVSETSLTRAGMRPSSDQARSARVEARKLIGSQTYVQNTKVKPRSRATRTLSR